MQIQILKAYIMLIDELMRVEVDQFSDGRLKLLVRFTKSDPNFWKHNDDGTFTWVMKKEEIKITRKALEAIDGYNLNSRAGDS